jgi:hypothetical protein
MGQTQSQTTIVDDIQTAITGTLVKQAANCGVNSTVNNKLTFDGDIIASGGGVVNINQGTKTSFDFTCTQDQKVQQQMQADMRTNLISKINQKLDGLGIGQRNVSNTVLRSANTLIDELNINDIAKCSSNLQTNNTMEFKSRVIAVGRGSGINITQSVSDVVHQNCVQNQLASNTNYKTLVSTLDASTDQSSTGFITANSLSSTSTSSSLIWMVGGVIVILSLFGGMSAGKGGGGGKGNSGGGQSISGSAITISVLIIIIWCICSCCMPK